jgi:hypothetical protein
VRRTIFKKGQDAVSRVSLASFRGCALALAVGLLVPMGASAALIIESIELPSSIPAGESDTCTIKVFNDGAGVESSVDVGIRRNPLFRGYISAGTEVSGWVWGEWDEDGHTHAGWREGVFAPGDTLQLQFLVHLESDAPFGYGDSPGSSFVRVGLDPINATPLDVVGAFQVDLDLSVTDPGGGLAAGQVSDLFIIRVTNAVGANAADSMVVSWELPAGFEGEFRNNAGPVEWSSAIGGPSDNIVTWSLNGGNTLAAGGTVELHVSIEPDVDIERLEGDEFGESFVELDTPNVNPNPQESVGPLNVRQVALTYSIELPETELSAGAESEAFKITVSNTEGDLDAENVRVRWSLPDAFEGVFTSIGGPAVWNPDIVEGDSVATWALVGENTLAAGASVILSVSIQPEVDIPRLPGDGDELGESYVQLVSPNDPSITGLRVAPLNVLQVALTYTVDLPDTDLSAGAESGAFEITISNAEGDLDADSLRVRWSLPGAFEGVFTRIEGPTEWNPAIVEADSVATWALVGENTLAAGDSVELSAFISPESLIEYLDSEELSSTHVHLTSPNDSTLAPLYVDSLHVRQYRIELSLLNTGAAGPLLAGDERTHQVAIENTGDKSAAGVSFRFLGSHPNLVVTAVDAPGWDDWVVGVDNLVSGTLLDGTNEMLEITWGYPCENAVSGEGNDCTITYEWRLPSGDPNLKIISNPTNIYCAKPNVSLETEYTDIEGDPDYFTSGAVDIVTFTATLTPLGLHLPGVEVTLDFWETSGIEGDLFEPADLEGLLADEPDVHEDQGNLIWSPWIQETGSTQTLAFPVRSTYVMYTSEETHEVGVSGNLISSLSVAGLLCELSIALDHSPASAEFKRVWLDLEPTSVPAAEDGVSAGDVLTYNMTLKNEGAAPLGNGQLRFTLASDFDDHEVTCVDSTHDFTYGVESNTIVISISDRIDPGSEVVFAYADTIPGRTEQGEVIVYSEEGLATIEANGDYVEVPVIIDAATLFSHTVANSKLELAGLTLDYEGDTDDLLPPGSTITLSLTLENKEVVAGAGDATRGLAIVVNHPLDESLFPLQNEGAGVSLDGESILITGSTIQPGGRETYTLEFFSDRHIPNDVLISFQGGLEGDAGDVSWTTSRWASDTTTVGPEASVRTANYELDFQAQISSGPVQFGREFELTLTVGNVGRYEAPALVVESVPRERQGMLLVGFPGFEGLPDNVQISNTPEGNEIQWVIPALGVETRGQGKARDAISLSIAYIPLLGDDIAFEYTVTSTGDDVILPSANFTDTSDLVLELIPIGEEILPLALFPCPYSGEGPARIVYFLSEHVASVRYRILDIRGVVVAKSFEDIKTLAATTFGVGTIHWNGETRGGGRLPNGPYYLELLIEREDGGIDRRIQKMAILR